MTSFGKRHTLKHLGTIRGSGSLAIGEGQRSLGPVSYEIDSYLDRTTHSATGEIEGESTLLAQAFAAGAAHIMVSGGRTVDVVLSDPQGGSVAEIVIRSSLPL